MTNEDAIEKLKDCTIYANGKASHEALDVAIEALKGKKTYKWHDIVKHPIDVPKDGVRVLSIRDNGLPYIAIYKNGRFESSNGRGFYKVEFWRYIDYPWLMEE